MILNVFKWRSIPTPASNSGKSILIASTVALLLNGSLVTDAASSRPVPSDFSSLADSKPDIVWRNRANGANSIWLMNGTNQSQDVSIASCAPTGWKIVGTGEYDGDSNNDLFWQAIVPGQSGDGAVAVWRMIGTTFQNAVAINPICEGLWRVVATADFNGDNFADLLLQHEITGNKCIEFMSGGANPIGCAELRDTNGNNNSDTNWVMTAAGDFGQFVNGAVNPTKDGTPDIVLRNFKTGQIAIWLMVRTNSTTSATFTGILTPGTQPDQDQKIVGAADFDDGGTGATDLLWRHAISGQNNVWKMGGTVYQNTAYKLSARTDPAWRIATQDMGDSTWRLPTVYGGVSATITPPGIRLDFNIQPKLISTTDPSLVGHIYINRRQLPGGSWTPMTTPLLPYNVTSWLDQNVLSGTRYEYEVARSVSDPGVYYTPSRIVAGISIPPTDNRGHVILLIDGLLENDAGVTSQQVDPLLRAQLTDALATFQKDLVGDGWRVTAVRLGNSSNPVRHDDINWGSNPQRIQTVKDEIAARKASDTACIIIIGHLAIPYSGTTGVDGHNDVPLNRPDHQGAWPADMYYGDLQSWPDTDQNLHTNIDFPDNSTFLGDKKFDPNFFGRYCDPTDPLCPPAKLEYAVGRIDFARLPQLGTDTIANHPTGAEIDLLVKYFTKNHKYRWRLAPFPLNERGVVYGTFSYNQQLVALNHVTDESNTILYENAVRNCWRFYGSGPGKLMCGDPYFQNSESSTWGFLAGPGAYDGISMEAGGGGIGPDWEHRSSQLANYSIQPPVAFYVFLGSYFGDWNIGTNFMRATLAQPNYPLAVMWTRYAQWRFAQMALGEHLGTGLTNMVNEPVALGESMAADQRRELIILGDPTLRLDTLAPPTGVTKIISGSQATLNWNSVTNFAYYIYKGTDTLAGPFNTLLAINPARPYTRSHQAGDVYMVRAVQIKATGSGSYYNISQGVIPP
ncbi:MAG: VCBS repeat-containing protein [Verrucomicrobiota bacterium]